MPTIRAELLSAYLLTASRVGAWAVVSGMVMRDAGSSDFGDLSLWRSSATLLGLLGAGLVPVVLRQLMVEAEAARLESGQGQISAGLESHILPYATPDQARRKLTESAVLTTAGGMVSALGVILGLLVLWLAPAGTLGGMAWERGREGLASMLLGALVRVAGDVLATGLQARGQLLQDNLAMSVSEWAWPVLLVLSLRVSYETVYSGELAAGMFFASGVIGYLARTILVRRAGLATVPTWRWTRAAWSLVLPSGVLLVSSLADFLYGSTNVLMLATFGHDVAVYTPALQIDGGLLLLTAAVSAVILPRVTGALARADVTTARRMYWMGTAASVAVLAVPAAVLGVRGLPILTAWLGKGVPPLAASVLPLVLIHTVIGGSSGVGRAVLLAAGRYRQFAAVAVGFALANAAGVYLVLKYTLWGVKGVVGVTIVTVALRCAIWMPWYVLRVLKELETQDPDEAGFTHVRGEQVPVGGVP